MNKILCVIAVVFFLPPNFAFGSFKRVPFFTESDFEEMLTMLEKQWYYPLDRKKALQCAAPYLKNKNLHAFSDLTPLISSCFKEDPHMMITPQAMVPTDLVPIRISAVPSNIENVSFGSIAIENFIPHQIDIHERMSYVLKRMHDNHVSDFLIDLAGNGGGFTNGAAAFLAYFAPAPETLFEVRNKFGVAAEPEDTYAVSEKGIFAHACTTVLVNKDTASAAEIIAHNLQLWGAYIVGEPTFKKGTGQILRNLQNGISIRFTYGKIFFPNNTTINKRGVIPDFLTNDPHTAREEAMKYLRKCHVKRERLPELSAHK